MIEQKDAMQLIGEWGYSPEELEKELTSLRERSSKIGDVVGASAFSSMLTVCRYAQSSDAKESVLEKSFPAEFLGLIGDELVEKMKSDEGEEFSEGVIETVYDKLKACKTFEEAMLKLRKDVMSTVAPLISALIAKNGSDVAEKVLECIVGADSVLANPSAKSILATSNASMALGKFVKNIKKYSEAIEACMNNGDEVLDMVARALIGDVEKMFDDVSEDMLSIVDSPPHKWTRYSSSFGRMLCGLIIALFLGRVSCDEFEFVISTFNMMGETKLTINFGRN